MQLIHSSLALRQLQRCAAEVAELGRAFFNVRMSGLGLSGNVLMDQSISGFDPMRSRGCQVHKRAR